MSAALRKVSVSRPCVWCLFLNDDIQHLRYCKARQAAQTKAARANVKEKDKEDAIQNARRNRSLY